MKVLPKNSHPCNSPYLLPSVHRLSQPTSKCCVDWSISYDLLGGAICGELPELSEIDAERSTGVPLLSAAESKCHVADFQTFVSERTHTKSACRNTVNHGQILFYL